jgi:hypothetical protein
MAYNLASAATAAGINNRVFLPLPSAATDSPPAQQDAHADALVAELKAVINDLRSTQQDALANALIAELKAVIDDLRSDPDHWRAGATAVP